MKTFYDNQVGFIEFISYGKPNIRIMKLAKVTYLVLNLKVALVKTKYKSEAA